MARQKLGFMAVVAGLCMAATTGFASDRAKIETVYIDAETNTWRAKGRVSFPLVPSLRNKLVGAGFSVVSESDQPHDLVLKVVYKEERGKEIRFGLDGTIITCRLRLEGQNAATLLDLTIQEFPPDDPSVTAPYTDVVHKLETNPYYYFLGEIVKERVESDRDTTGGLIVAFARLTDRRDPVYGSMVGTPPNPGDTLPPAEELYVREVRANTMRELARLRDDRAIPILTNLLNHPEWRVRRNAVNALAAMQAHAARPRIEQVADQDSEQSVREAAKVALSELGLAKPETPETRQTPDR